MKKLFLSILLISNLFSHPHIFMDIYSDINIQNNEQSTVKFTWKIDEMTSSMLIMESDVNLDNKIDATESKYIYENFFLHLDEFDYYTDIKINNKKQNFPQIKNFKAYIEDHKLCYEFELSQKYDIKNTTFDFGDKDFFVAFMIKDEFLNIQGAKAKITEVDNDFFFGYKLEFQ